MLNLIDIINDSFSIVEKNMSYLFSGTGEIKKYDYGKRKLEWSIIVKAKYWLFNASDFLILFYSNKNIVKIDKGTGKTEIKSEIEIFHLFILDNTIICGLEENGNDYIC